MSTAIEICSNALVELGQRPISSFSDLSDRQRAAADSYPQIRDSVLRSHPWNCAKRRVVLSPDSETPSFGWSYQFTLPGDWLRTLSISQDRERIPYEMEIGSDGVRRILCDESVLYLRYIFRNDNPATWDSLLLRAVTVSMATVLAIPVTSNSDLKIEKERELREVLRQARAVDGQEEPPDEVDDYPLLMERF